MFLNKRIPAQIRKAYSFDSMSSILFGVFNTIYIAFAPILMRKLGADDFTMGIISVSPMAGAILIFVWLHMALKSDKITFVVLMKSTGMIILLIPLIFTSPLTFAICYLLYNVFAQGNTSAYVSIMKSIYPTKFRGSAMGMSRIEYTIIAAAISLIAGRLFDIFDYRMLFLIAICAGLFSQLVFYKIKTIFPVKKIKTSITDSKLFEFLTILKNDKLLFKYFSIFFLQGFGFLLNVALFPIYLVDELHISYTFLGIINFLFFISMISGFYLWGKHIDKHNPLKTRVCLMFILMFIPLFFFLMGKVTIINMVLVMLVYICRGFSFSGGELSRINFITRVVDYTMIEKYWTIDFFLLGVRGILAPVFGLLLKNLLGFKPVFLLSFCMILLSSVLMLNYYVKNHKMLKARGLIRQH